MIPFAISYFVSLIDNAPKSKSASNSLPFLYWQLHKTESYDKQKPGLDVFCMQWSASTSQTENNYHIYTVHLDITKVSFYSPTDAQSVLKKQF